MRGTVVTFYSYKGGVGRSFALVNAAALLGRWGFRVLCIDWDLEAPGLEDFFSPFKSDDEFSTRSGLVELLADFAKFRQTPLQWRDYVCGLRTAQLPGVKLIKAGRSDSDYMRRVQQLNWTRLYKQGLGEALEIMFDELRNEYDFILIDSRTGITDFSGIVTAQLPDILAFLFTANEQSLVGATSVARRAAEIRNDLAMDRSKLLLLPIPARFEAQVEHRISMHWRNRFVAALEEFYTGWANQDVPAEKLIQAATIPYVPFWSFGERISVVEDPSSDSSSINYSMENLAALLAHKLGQTRLLAGSRDEYVGAARRLARIPDQKSVFLSYSRENRDLARRIQQSLHRYGVSTWTEDNLPSGSKLEGFVDRVEKANHFVLLLGKDDRHNRWVDAEVRTFLRQAASDEAPRLFIPFITRDTRREDLPTIVQPYRFHVLTDDADDAALKIWSQIHPVEAEPSEAHVLRVRVTSEGNVPVAGAHICALSENGTSVESVTDDEGRATLELRASRAYKILSAHSSYLPAVIKDFHTHDVLELRLKRQRAIGSAVLQSSGYIPGLNGRLNPILDTLNRTYLYADNIAVDGGKKQPTAFTVDEPFILEDNQGNVIRAAVRLIEGRTTLIEYEKVTSHLEALVVLRNDIERSLRTAADREFSEDPAFRKNSRMLSLTRLAEKLLSDRADAAPLLQLLRSFTKTANAALHGESVEPGAIRKALGAGRQALLQLDLTTADPPR
ncbi:KGGVGR-motif variant AAA ATPase [Ensifer sp. ENS11]|uniref:KGGVGR-motif variant AAA ATPase n=1 Tax=Ensifer sp. ENS11 TaxID=2769291 RepID=UPI001785E439|nr:TIR domain-containing protein [Ensifer sp. ENS11]MBD9489941.1 TIR domain-containing protein [Ensifer sp. ENS11]